MSQARPSVVTTKNFKMILVRMRHIVFTESDKISIIKSHAETTRACRIHWSDTPQNRFCGCHFTTTLCHLSFPDHLDILSFRLTVFTCSVSCIQAGPWSTVYTCSVLVFTMKCSPLCTLCSNAFIRLVFCLCSVLWLYLYSEVRHLCPDSSVFNCVHQF